MSINNDSPIIYEVYYNGSLGGGPELTFHHPFSQASDINQLGHNPNPDGSPYLTYTSQSSMLTTSGGTCSSTSPYIYCTSPNGGSVSTLDTFCNTIPFTDKTGGTNALGLDTNIYRNLDGSTVKFRLHFRTYQVKIQWSDGVTTIPLMGRACAIGTQEFIYDFGLGPDSRTGNPPSVYFCGPGEYSIIASGVNAGKVIPAVLTDSSGVAIYYVLVGISILTAQSNDGVHYYPNWLLFDPAGGDAGSFDLFAPWNPYGNPQRLPTDNVSLATNYKEEFMRPGSINSPPLDHTFSQWITDSSGSPHTSGWKIDYPTAWTGYNSWDGDVTTPTITGVLNVSATSLHTFTYNQDGVVNIRNSDRSIIPATITLSGSNGKTYSGTSGSTIAGIPNGSLLTQMAFSGDYNTPITDFPLISTSDYESASVTGRIPHVVFPGDGSQFDLTYTSKTSTDLLGTNIVYHVPVFGMDKTENLSAGAGLFMGGEVITEYYSGTWAATDSSGRNGSFYFWIHEDQTRLLDIIVQSPVQSLLSQDYCLEPGKEGAWLSNAVSQEVDQWNSGNQELSFGYRAIINEAMLYPSRVITHDHIHYIAGIDGNGSCNLWKATDLLTWTKQGVISANAPNLALYTSCTLRESDDSSIYCFLCDVNGKVYETISSDGGDSWGTILALTSLPLIFPGRIEFRFDSGIWYATCGLATTQDLDLYSSRTGSDDFIFEKKLN